MKNTTIKQETYAQVAHILGVDIPTILAVRQVESGRNGGFIADGRPVVLFEGHVFYQRLKARGRNVAVLAAKHPSIIYPRWTKKYYLDPVGEWNRLHEAMAIHRDAAREAASWGAYQILGMNYRLCGCSSIDEFCNVMSSDEDSQLMLFAKFIMANGWHHYLQSHQWELFARHYNGPAYKKNNYDSRLKAAYESFYRNLKF